jgi:hypothetical protein
MLQYPNVGDGTCKASALVVMKLVESPNVRILMKGIDYCQEVGVVRIWLYMYRDSGEYIYTWKELEAGEVREWTDVPLQRLRNSGSLITHWV